jgi:hypothetical protein
VYWDFSSFETSPRQYRIVKILGPVRVGNSISLRPHGHIGSSAFDFETATAPLQTWPERVPCGTIKRRKTSFALGHRFQLSFSLMGRAGRDPLSNRKLAECTGGS